MAGPGLYATIQAKRKRGGKMQKKVKRVHQSHQSLKELKKQRGKNND